MIRTGLKRHARHGRSGGHGPLTLVPMIDMLTILVVYLLVHAADTEILPNTRNLSIPQSVSEQKPRETALVTVTRDTVYLDGAPLMSVAALAGSPGPVVEPLRSALARPDGAAVPGDGAAREVTVMAEKSLPYAVLRRIVASCAAADCGKVSLAVVERESPLAARTGA